MATHSGSGRLLTLQETADWLGTSERHVRRLVAERRITYLKIGGKLRFRRADVERFIDAGRVEAVGW
jgi:excisionase family DNA binding protein